MRSLDLWIIGSLFLVIPHLPLLFLQLFPLFVREILILQFLLHASELMLSIFRSVSPHPFFAPPSRGLVSDVVTKYPGACTARSP